MSTGGRKTRRRYQSRLTSTLPSSTLALWWVWLLEHSRCLSSFLFHFSPSCFSSLSPSSSLHFSPSSSPLSFSPSSFHHNLILRPWNVLMIHSTIWSPWQQRDYILHSQNDIHAIYIYSIPHYHNSRARLASESDLRKRRSCLSRMCTAPQIRPFFRINGAPSGCRDAVYSTNVCV